MVKVREDLTGQRFGKLTVVEQAEDYITPKGEHRSRWRCMCDCGKTVAVQQYTLKNGGTRSCGCLLKERVSETHKEYNTYDLTSNDYGVGYTSNGKIFYFDLDDYNKIKDYYWGISKTGYVVHAENRKVIYLHRFVMSTPEYLIVDHLNRNKMDNRKSNLRNCTYTENNRNLSKSLRNTSGRTGVGWRKDLNKWEARIYNGGVRLYLGAYENIEDAIKARKEAEEKYGYISQE